MDGPSYKILMNILLVYDFGIFKCDIYFCLGFRDFLEQMLCILKSLLIINQNVNISMKLDCVV